MSDMLSQDEINALLKGMSEEEQDITSDKEKELEQKNDKISKKEIDAVGEISNISMGTAATTLYALLGQKVNITTPEVSVSSWEELTEKYEKPLVAVQIVYKEGLDGDNILFLQEEDVKIITNLMMGGDGTNIDEELNEMHLSAISEAMNQMVGSSSTSLSQMFDKKIDIAPPESKRVLVSDASPSNYPAEFLNGEFIKVSFRLKIGELIDSELIQLYPFSFLDEITENFAHYSEAHKEEGEAIVSSEPVAENSRSSQPVQEPVYAEPTMSSDDRTVDVRRAQFETFEQSSVVGDKSNIDLIMDVPLNVTVELGRTNRSIKEILEFSPGTIIELDKIAGEPIDVLVNGKVVAKGEVVVIAENFSIRITEIIKNSNSINII